MSNEQPSETPEKRRHPRIRINLPIHARARCELPLILQLWDIGPQGMQLRITRADFQTLGKAEEPFSQFEIQIKARLAWVRPDEGGDLNTGWEFDLLEEDERIG